MRRQAPASPSPAPSPHRATTRSSIPSPSPSPAAARTRATSSPSCRARRPCRPSRSAASGWSSAIPPPHWLTPAEWEAVRLSLAVAARAVGFGLPLAVIAAFVLARCRFWGRGVLNALVHLPMVLPPVVVGWLLLLVFGVRGPVGALLLAWFGVRLAFTTAGAALACAT